MPSYTAENSTEGQGKDTDDQKLGVMPSFNSHHKPGHTTSAADETSRAAGAAHVHTKDGWGYQGSGAPRQPQPKHGDPAVKNHGKPEQAMNASNSQTRIVD